MASKTSKRLLIVKKITIITEEYDIKDLSFKLTDEEASELYNKRLPPPDRLISFELHGTNSKFINYYRTYLIDNIYLLSLTCNLSDIKSNDRKIMFSSDCIVRQLNLIPLNQDILTSDIFSKYQVFVDAANTTMETISVTTADIKIIKVTEHPKKKPKSSSVIKSKNPTGTVRRKSGGAYPDGIAVDISTLLCTKINLCDLDRGCYLKINNITVTSQKNFDCAIGSVVYGIEYVPMEYEEELEVNSKKKLPSCFVVHPTKYRFGFGVNGTTHPMYIAKLVCTTIISRLTKIYDDIAKYEEIPEYLEVVDVTYEGSLINYKIYGEAAAFGNLLSWYCQQIDKAIPFIAAKNEHMLINTIILRIRHADHKKIILLAMTDIIADYNTLLSALSDA